MKFQPGQIVATPGALRALEEAGQSPALFLERHLAGDWGELDPEDVKENEFSLAHGFRLLSAYRLSSGVRIWIITEADRSLCLDRSRCSRSSNNTCRNWRDISTRRSFLLLVDVNCRRT
jgi:hypothetical protein